MRRALIRTDSAEVVARYMPANYAVTGAHYDDRGRLVVVVEGEDDHGWTMQDYVLPRLASGLHFGVEVDPDRPVEELIKELK